MDPAAHFQQEKAGGGAHQQDQKDHQDACNTLADLNSLSCSAVLPRRYRKEAAQRSFGNADQRSDPLHRMPESVWIADQKIHSRRDEEHDYSVLRRLQQKMHFFNPLHGSLKSQFLFS